MVYELRLFPIWRGPLAVQFQIRPSDHSFAKVLQIRISDPESLSRPATRANPSQKPGEARTRHSLPRRFILSNGIKMMSQDPKFGGGGNNRAEREGEMSRRSGEARVQSRFVDGITSLN